MSNPAPGRVDLRPAAYEQRGLNPFAVMAVVMALAFFAAMEITAPVAPLLAYGANP